MYKVSVILPTYNRGKYVVEAVESVLRQTYNNYEIIIVDDGSTDTTEDILKRFVKNNNNIQYIKQSNKGHAGARNTGLLAASGDLIAFIDSDDIWLPEKLEEQVKECEKDPDVNLVYCNVYGFSEHKKPEVRDPQLTEDQLKDYSGYIFDNLFYRKIIITTTTVLIRKKCIDSVGMFDENLTRCGSEDRDLFLRILWKSKAKYINKPLVLSRILSGSAGDNYQRMIKGQEYVYEKITRMYGLPAKAKDVVMSKVYQEWSRSFYSKGIFWDGLNNQLKAIIANPSDINAYLSIKRFARHLTVRISNINDK